MVATIIVGSIIAVLLVLDARYIYSQKKKGVCIGCAEAGSCSGNCKGCDGTCGKPMTKEEIKAAADNYIKMVKAKNE